jgi:hypothetical protein
MTSPANNDIKENIMMENPLNICQIKQAERPKWLCDHPGARVLSFDPRRYICNKCNKSYILKIVSQKDILAAISTNILSPTSRS